MVRLSTNTYTYLSNGLLRTAANEQGTVSNSWSYANRLTNVLSDFQVSGVAGKRKKTADSDQ